MTVIQKREIKNGKTHFRVLIRLKGYPLQTKTFDRKTDAVIWAKRTEADLQNGTYKPRAAARKCSLLVNSSHSKVEVMKILP